MLKIKIYYVRVSRIKYTYFNNEQNVAPQHTTFRKSKNAMDLFSFVWCSLVCVALLQTIYIFCLLISMMLFSLLIFFSLSSALVVVVIYISADCAAKHSFLSLVATCSINRSKHTHTQRNMQIYIFVVVDRLFVSFAQTMNARHIVECCVFELCHCDHISHVSMRLPIFSCMALLSTALDQ